LFPVIQYEVCKYDQQPVNHPFY